MLVRQQRTRSIVAGLDLWDFGVLLLLSEIVVGRSLRRHPVRRASTWVGGMGFAVEEAASLLQSSRPGPQAWGWRAGGLSGQSDQHSRAGQRRTGTAPAGKH